MARTQIGPTFKTTYGTPTAVGVTKIPFAGISRIAYQPLLESKLPTRAAIR